MNDIPTMNDPLAAPYPLTGDDIRTFADQGFIKLKNVFDADVLEDYGREITRLTLALNDETRPLAERSTYDRAFLQVMNLWERSQIARAFVFSRRLARIAAELLGTRGVRLYHDQSLYKEPGGGITPAHADQYYWPFQTDRSVTAWIPLQPVPLDMGPLGFFGGSQRIAHGRDLPISDHSEESITTLMQDAGIPLNVEPFDLGEVSFHQGWTFHKAGPNQSKTPRSVMTIIYMDAEMKLKQPTNRSQEHDRNTWCPGIVPDEVIATRRNPVLYWRP